MYKNNIETVAELTSYHKGLEEKINDLVNERTILYKERTDDNADEVKEKAIKIQKGSGKPNMEKVAKITKAQVREIAEQKMPDLNAASLEAAMSMIAGTCRSMGVIVGE